MHSQIYKMSTTAGDPLSTSGMGPFDSGTFLSKMHYFYPSFFNKLSTEEVDYLSNHESWVLNIFRTFWDLLLKNLDENVVHFNRQDRSNETFLSNNPQPLSPSADSPLDASPISFLHPVDPSLDYKTPLSFVYDEQGILAFKAIVPPLFDPTYYAPDSFHPSMAALNSKQLPICNQTNLLPSASLRSNITVRKKSKACLPKVPPGSTEGGIASLNILSPCNHEANHSQFLSPSGPSDDGHGLTPVPTLQFAS